MALQRGSGASKSSMHSSVTANGESVVSHAGPRLLADVADRTTLTQLTQAVAGAAQAVVPALAWPTACPRSLTSPWWRDNWRQGHGGVKTTLNQASFHVVSMRLWRKQVPKAGCTLKRERGDPQRSRMRSWPTSRAGRLHRGRHPARPVIGPKMLRSVRAAVPSRYDPWLPTVCLSTEEGRSG
jgi:hypothetical protein